MQQTKGKQGSGWSVSLSWVICTVIVLVSLATTTLVSYVNYQKYTDAVFTVYAQSARDTSAAIEACLPADTWARYADAVMAYRQGALTDDDLAQQVEDQDEYWQAAARIQELTDSFDLAGVSVFALDMEGMNAVTEADYDELDTDLMSFLMDFYPTGSDAATYGLGDADGWWTCYEDLTVYREYFSSLLESGEDVTLHEDTDDGSSLLTEYYPIRRDGGAAAIIMVSVNARQISSFMQTYLAPTLLLGLGITLALSLAAAALIQLRTIRPLKAMTAEAGRFVSGGEQQPQPADSLLRIRTHDEIQRLARSLHQMEQDACRYVDEVARVTGEKERIRTELSVATRIQEDMLPRVFPPYPDRPEFSVYASMDPAKEVGGDFYDFFFVDADHLALVMADVAGKGVPASLFMVIAKTLIKTRAQQGGDPADILADVNNQLCDGNASNMFVTVWLAIVDLRTGQGVAANAGHEHPVRRSAGGLWELVKYRHSPAVAMYEDVPFRQHDFALAPGDCLFVYTDGLPEATNAADELFGAERMLAQLNRDPAAPLPTVLPAMTAAVADFVGDAPQFDDLTMLVFAYHGPKQP